MTRKDYDPSTVPPDGRPAKRHRFFDPEVEGAWHGHLLGRLTGGDITVLAYGNDEPGTGPRLHVHPYDETFIIVAGRARFQVGDQLIEAQAGDVVFGPKGLPHRFENLGPGRLQTIDIHHSPVWIQTDID